MTIGALLTRGHVAFNQWIGWAAVAAVLVAVAMGWPTLWDKIVGTPAEAPDIEMIERGLADKVLDEAQVERSRLIGTDIAGDDAASIPFVRIGTFREVGGEDRADLASILEYFQSLDPAQRLVVLGQPGCGKTVLALELQVRLLEARGQNPGDPVAIRISAAAYDSGQRWQDWLAAHLANRYVTTTETMLQLIRAGRILPLVDGVDEMDDPAGPPRRAQALVDALNEAMQGRQRARVLVTCRPQEYQALSVRLDHATHIEMLPLTGKEAASYLRQQFRTADELDRWEVVLNYLEGDPKGLLATQMGTPWRLMLALTVFRARGDPSELLPSLNVDPDTYRQKIDNLLLSDYVSSAVSLHGKGRYSEEKVRRWLTTLADGLAWQARHGRSGTDIRLDEWWVPDGHLTIRISHIILASLPALPWLIAGAATGNAWFFIPAGAVLLLSANAAGRTSSAKRLGLKSAISKRGWQAFRHAVWIGIIDWMLPGPSIGFLYWLATDFRDGGRGLLIDAIAVAGGLGFLVGAPVGVNRGLMDAFAESTPHTVGPREVIQADTRFRIAVALAAGFLIGIPVGLFSGLGHSVALGVAFGAATGVTAGLTAALAGASNLESAPVWIRPSSASANASDGGASAFTRYYVTVLINALRHSGPLRFSDFLDWSQQAGLLRVLGVAYQFRHRQLQDLLTTPANTSLSSDTDSSCP